MSIKIGDTVKIVDDPSIQHSQYVGKTGKVVHVFPSGETFKVDLSWKVGEGEFFETFGALANFARTELELVEAADEDTQVEKIAEALKKEEIRGWIEVDYQETAKSLYRSGVRFPEEGK